MYVCVCLWEEGHPVPESLRYWYICMYVSVCVCVCVGGGVPVPDGMYIRTYVCMYVWWEGGHPISEGAGDIDVYVCTVTWHPV